ncbi:anti-repressor SinI family protein [Neobacillus sp. YIM B02564]|uniref:Anti-repressor SinI family protein n=1 Tax=Neobacillus paridis TaxID=2803862 RepID=A0ABS1TTT9_9BACI|nr:anti-repressor SinI family protein [Neobacillus paridis]
MVLSESVVEKIDEEWVYLILEAKKLGLTIAEVQSFLNQKNT